MGTWVDTRLWQRRAGIWGCECEQWVGKGCLPGCTLVLQLSGEEAAEAEVVWVVGMPVGCLTRRYHFQARPHSVGLGLSIDG